MTPIQKRTSIVLSLVGVVLIAFYGSGLLSKGPGSKITSTATQRQSTSVQTAVIVPSHLDYTIRATGTVLANEEIDLKNEVPGRIVALNFTEGQPVQQGALLVKLNDADLQASRKKLELQVQLAESEEARTKKLLEGQLTSQEIYDVALNKLLTARADLENIKAAIAKTEIYAPFSGIIGLRSVSKGSNISQATSIARIQQVDPVKIEFAVPEKYQSSIRVGTQIQFTVSGSDRVYSGQVYAIDPKINIDTRTISVRALSRNPDRTLFPGGFAKVMITLRSISDALTVPSTAIVPELNGQKVFVYSGGKAVAKKIDIGLRTDSSVQVTQGLAIGDTLITTGVSQIREGAFVTRLSK